MFHCSNVVIKQSINFWGKISDKQTKLSSLGFPLPKINYITTILPTREKINKWTVHDQVRRHLIVCGTFQCSCVWACCTHPCTGAHVNFVSTTTHIFCIFLNVHFVIHSLIPPSIFFQESREFYISRIEVLEVYNVCVQNISCKFICLGK